MTTTARRYLILGLVLGVGLLALAAAAFVLIPDFILFRVLLRL